MIPAHIHKYKRVILNDRVLTIIDGKKYLRKSGTGTLIYKCMVPGCPTYKIKDLMEGEKSRCWKCGDELTITSKHLMGIGVAKPVHEYCKRGHSLDEPEKENFSLKRR